MNMASERQKSILVVEDDKILGIDLKLTLESLGYIVLGPAAQYDDALRLAVTHEPDIALMDIHIKGAKTGIDTAKALQENLDIPVIFLTSTVKEATMSKAIETEPAGYLLKPFRKEELKNNIEIAYKLKERTRQLKNDLNRYSSALQNVDMPLILTDSFGKINEINSSAENLSGWMTIEKKAHSLDDIFIIKGGAKTFWQELSSNEALQSDTTEFDATLNFNNKLHLIKKTGEELLVSTNINPYFDADGSKSGYIIHFKETLIYAPKEEQSKLLDVTEEVKNGNSIMMDGYVFIKDKSQLFRVKVDDILFIEALGDYVNVFTLDKKYTTLMTMKKLEANLPSEKFCRVHRSHIVNIDKVTEINGNEYDLYVGKKRIPIGETYKAELLKRIKII